MKYNDTRHEFKYVLNQFQARSIESFVRKIGLQRDESQNGSYPVTSLYFDTPTLEDYYDKLAGLKYRKKLRTRVYENRFENNKNKIWLEIKEKHDMNINKTRCAISIDVLQKLLDKDVVGFSSAASSQENEFLKRFAYLYWSKGYRPHIIVRYNRKAYVDRFFSSIRLTFDSDLETCTWNNFKYNNAIMTPVQQHAVIMEIKFHTAMPWWFREIINRFGLSRQAISKYTTAADIINCVNPLPR